MYHIYLHYIYTHRYVHTYMYYMYYTCVYAQKYIIKEDYIQDKSWEELTYITWNTLLYSSNLNAEWNFMEL